MTTSDPCDARPQLRRPVPDPIVVARSQFPTRSPHLQTALCCRPRLIPTGLLVLMTSLTLVRADALSDCTQVKITAKTIDNCTQVIEAGQVDKSGLAWAHFNRGTALGIQGRLDRAIADLDKAIELNPQWVAAHSNRGLAFLGKGEPERAVED